jgi:hypothetical protein
MLKTGGDFAGDGINFNQACGDPSFKVTGHVDTNDTAVILQGDRGVLDSSCNSDGTRHETLRFAKFDPSKPSGGDPHPVGLTCPFALPPGQQPQVVDGREIPPKSERSCNFTALTVPGNLSFDHMPRYIREWPGVRKDVLIDKFEDQIITFQSAETGIGAWFYWLTNRAVNGPGLAKQGFGANGRPTLAAVSRAIAGAERSEDFVRKTYLGPYLAFANEFFGRVVTESEPLDLANTDVRWNLGRTMFRLESGRTPVVSRKQFECGIILGSDVTSDFTRAERGNNLTADAAGDYFDGHRLPIILIPSTAIMLPKVPRSGVWRRSSFVQALQNGFFREALYRVLSVKCFT